MKRAICLFLILLFSVSFLVACGNDSEKTDNNNNKNLTVNDDENVNVNKNDHKFERTAESAKNKDISDNDKETENLEDKNTDAADNNNENISSTNESGLGAFDIELAKMLPSSVVAVGYINLAKIHSMDQIKDMIEKNMDGEMSALMEKKDDFIKPEDADQTVFGVGSISNSTNPESVDFCILMKGKYDRQAIIDTKNELKLEEETNVKGVDGLTNGEVSVLFINDMLLAIMTNSKIDSFVDSIVNKTNRIDENAEILSRLNKMDNNIFRIVGDLTSIGPVDISMFADEASGIGNQATLGITELGISDAKDTLALNVKTSLEEEKVASVLAEKITAMLPFIIAMGTGSLTDEELKADITELANNFKIENDKNTIFTKINLKKSTLNKLQGLAGELGGNL